MTEELQTHKVWRLPAHVDTDALAPGPYMQLGIEGIAPHCLEQLRPEFAGSVVAGDVIVAGTNFGVGSSREQAAGVLKHLGISHVIAPGFAGLFYRNAINLGLPLLICERAGEIGDGQIIRINKKLAMIDVMNATGKINMQLPYEPLPNFLQAMIDAGGLLAQLRAKFDAGRDLGHDGQAT